MDAFPPTAPEASCPLALPLVVHAGGLVMIGDGADPTRIYESPDGQSWRAYRHNTDWSTRYGASDASFHGALWRIGGFVEAGGRRVLMNDVWRSMDGRRWERLLPHAPWPPRVRAHLVSFRDTLWLIGGEPNDRVTWFTVDGLAWGSRPTPGLPELNPQGIVVFHERLWILGHGTWDSATNDVWSSSDGATWTRIAASAAWPARTGAGFGVLQDQIWVVGGATRRDTWFAPDGARWSRGPDLPGPPRAADYSVVFQGGLWVFGGKTGGAGGTGFWDGVWYLK